MVFSHRLEKESLALTACWIAAIRAHESERVDRLFNDPWAALLAGQAGQEWLDRMAALQARFDRMSNDYRISIQWGNLGQELGRPKLRFDTAAPPTSGGISASDKEISSEIGVVIRTKFFDDFLLQATREHHVSQVVMLAAGMDTRAFRLPWPAHTWVFEIDQSELLQQKRQLLSHAGASPACRHLSIGADLEGPWPGTLLRTGFDPHKTSVWLIEGFLPYLAEAAVSRLLERVTALSAPGSWLGLTAFNREMLTSPATRLVVKSMEQAGTPWLSVMDDPETFLLKHQWTATVAQPGEESANFGRWPYPVVPRTKPRFPRTWLVTASRS